MKLLIAVVSLIIVVMVAGAYFHFNPAIPIFIILGGGIFILGRTSEPLPPTRSGGHWGSGHGIYFDRDDVWVQGSDADEVRPADRDRSSG